MVLMVTGGIASLILGAVYHLFTPVLAKRMATKSD